MNPSHLPSISALLAQPIFWSAKDIKDFSVALSDLLETMFHTTKKPDGLSPENQQILKAHLNEYEHLLQGIGGQQGILSWIDHLDDTIVTHVNSKVYKASADGLVLRSLLRFMRNTFNHGHEWPYNVRQIIGESPEKTAEYFTEKFPHLMTTLYQFGSQIVDCDDSKRVSKYYSSVLPMEENFRDPAWIISAIQNVTITHEHTIGGLLTRYKVLHENKKTGSIQLLRSTDQIDSQVDPMNTVVLKLDKGKATIARYLVGQQQHHFVQTFNVNCFTLPQERFMFIIGPKVKDALKRIPDSLINCKDQFEVIIITSQKSLEKIQKKIGVWATKLKVSLADWPLKWEELTEEYQSVLLERCVKLQGKLIPMKKIFQAKKSLLHQLEGQTLFEISENWEPELFHIPNSEIPPYYVGQVEHDKLFDQLKDKVGANQKVVILSGVAGVGKSTLLTKFAVDLQPARLVICMTLNWLVLKLRKRIPDHIIQTRKNVKVEDVLDAMVVEIEKDNWNRQLLREIILDSTFEKEVMLDAFDEVQSDNAQLGLRVLKLLNEIGETCNIRIWVTTRPKIAPTLEAKFCTTAYTVAGLPIDGSGVHEIIKQHWRTSPIFQENPVDDDTLHKYASACVDHVTTQALLSTPFVCVTLAQTFEYYLYNEKNVNRKSASPIQSMVDVFELLINSKVLKYVRKEAFKNDASGMLPRREFEDDDVNLGLMSGNRLYRDTREMMDWLHIRLAFATMMQYQHQEDVLLKMDPMSHFKTAVKLMFKELADDDTENDLTEYGLVSNKHFGVSFVANSFLHISVAEYYLALYLAKVITAKDSVELPKEVLTTVVYYVIRCNPSIFDVGARNVGKSGFSGSALLSYLDPLLNKSISFNENFLTTFRDILAPDGAALKTTSVDLKMLMCSRNCNAKNGMIRMLLFNYVVSNRMNMFRMMIHALSKLPEGAKVTFRSEIESVAQVIMYKFNKSKNTTDAYFRELQSCGFPISQEKIRAPPSYGGNLKESKEYAEFIVTSLHLFLCHPEDFLEGHSGKVCFLFPLIALLKDERELLFDVVLQQVVKFLKDVICLNDPKQEVKMNAMGRIISTYHGYFDISIKDKKGRTFMDAVNKEKDAKRNKSDSAVNCLTDEVSQEIARKLQDLTYNDKIGANTTVRAIVKSEDHFCV